MAVFGEYQQFARDFMSSEGLDEVDPIAAMRAAAGAESEGGPPLFSKEFFEAQMEVVIEEKVPDYAAGLGNPGPGMDRARQSTRLNSRHYGAPRMQSSACTEQHNADSAHVDLRTSPL